MEPPRFCKLYESQQLAAVAAALCKHEAAAAETGAAAAAAGVKQKRRDESEMPSVGDQSVTRGALVPSNGQPSMCTTDEFEATDTKAMASAVAGGHPAQQHSSGPPPSWLHTLMIPCIPTIPQRDVPVARQSQFSMDDPVASPSTELENLANLHQQLLNTSVVSHAPHNTLQSPTTPPLVHAAPAAESAAAEQVRCMLDAFGTQSQHCLLWHPQMLQLAGGQVMQHQLNCSIFSLRLLLLPC